MRAKLYFLAFLLVCLAASGVLAANTETPEENKIITLVLDGSTDWDSRWNHPGGLALDKILFYSSAPNDILMLRQNGPLGSVIFVAKSTLGDPLAFKFPDNGTLLKPFIKSSDCTLGTPANALVLLYLK
jgi:hypothetical protein